MKCRSGWKIHNDAGHESSSSSSSNNLSPGLSFTHLVVTDQPSREQRCVDGGLQVTSGSKVLTEVCCLEKREGRKSVETDSHGPGPGATGPHGQ
ncbi:hypothetical protein INR49_021227 [Caranx melampygus]|nr:hypothetical protein INR49_021227 [Caranx melampygus]